MTAATTTPIEFAGYHWDFPGPQLTELRDCNDLLADPPALRQRLAADGYLLVRGLHARQDSLAARRRVLEELRQRGLLHPDHPLEDGIVGPQGKGQFMGGFKPVTHSDEFLRIVESPRLLSFFADVLGAPVVTYDFKWLRAVVQKEFTGMHYDVVYMGRGSRDLLTCWTPMGDVSLDMGPLALCLGSQHFEKIKATYGQMDVDRDRVQGWFSGDPAEITDKFGGQWATTSFGAGDILVFGMYMMHGSLTNTSNRYRISSDTRYQRQGEPIDERWVGDKPRGHYNWHTGPGTPMTEARAKWGV